MRICFFNRDRLEHILESECVPQADVYCFDFSVMGEVSYEKELSGATDTFGRLAYFSKKFDCAAIGGCYTDLRGVKRKSAVAADRGKLIGVADANNILDNKNYKCGSGLKIFPAQAGKIGVAVGEDVLFPEVIKSLTLCGSDVIVCIYERLRDTTELTVMKANAYVYGVNICMCAKNYCQAVNAKGNLAFGTSASPFVFDFQMEREYRVVESRYRGFFRKEK